MARSELRLGQWQVRVGHARQQAVLLAHGGSQTRDLVARAGSRVRTDPVEQGGHSQCYQQAGWVESWWMWRGGPQATMLA